MSAYRTIVADPPWSPALGSTWATATSDKARPQKHYATMSLAEIKAASPPAARQAHLYLWVLNQHVDWGYEVARAWGFEPVQMLTWTKPGLGVGRFQCNTEQILVARKGSRHGNPFGATGGTWFSWPRGRHSKKPEEFYALVERVSPGPYFEMYARTWREGWDAMGNELPERWYGACGVEFCSECLPRYDESNNVVPDVDTAELAADLLSYNPGHGDFATAGRRLADLLNVERRAVRIAPDDLAATVAHRLTCTRCRQGWTCGGLGEDDYEAGARIVDLLPTETTVERLTHVLGCHPGTRENDGTPCASGLHSPALWGADGCTWVAEVAGCLEELL